MTITTTTTISIVGNDVNYDHHIQYIHKIEIAGNIIYRNYNNVKDAYNVEHSYTNNARGEDNAHYDYSPYKGDKNVDGNGYNVRK